MRDLINQVRHAVGYFVVVKVLAKAGIYLAPAFPLKVDRDKDYWIDDESGDPVYRHNAHQIMRDHGQTECGTMHPDDHHPGSVYGCLACDVEGMCYMPMSLITRLVIGTRHHREFLERMYA